MTKHIICVILVLVLNVKATAQRFVEDVASFDETIDSKSSTLLIGSSSFTMWKDANNYFPTEKIVNRAFGGSTLQDLFFYKKEIIDPYQATKIWIYCGENDFAENEKLSPNQVFARFDSLYSYIRLVNPKAHIFYVSMKPSPSRWHLKDKFQATNALISQKLMKDKLATYIDVWPMMLTEDGQPKGELFLEDQLHMNKGGYAIWAKLLNDKLKFISQK